MLLVFNIANSEEAPLQDIGQLVWKNRIILIWQDQNASNYENLFEQYNYEINDRDVVWFILKEEQAITNYVGKLSKEFIARTRSAYPIEQGRVLLIGKDGGIKDRNDDLLLNSIFEKIDSMPMRRQETQN